MPEPDVIVPFAERRSALVRRLRKARAAMGPDTAVWPAWPKKASGVPTDLGDRVVQEAGLAAGLVDDEVCAIDATWSALRFVVRVGDRPGR